MAGVDSDTRAIVDAAVRHALGGRIVTEDWTVSLVRIGGQWSVTLDGPEPRFHHLSFTAEQSRLSSAIREAIGDAPAKSGPGHAAHAPVGGASGAPSAGERRVALACERCSQQLVVVYEAQPGEPLVGAAVACPHCWQVNRVEIGEWAASGRDYRAEKA